MISDVSNACPTDSPSHGRLILFFYHSMNLYGGIQTLILRLAKNEISKGNRVKIISDSDDILHEVAKIGHVEIGNILQETGDYLKEYSIDVLAFAPNSAAIAMQFCWTMVGRGVKIRFATGVYHPRDFFRENERKHLHILNYFLARAIGENNIFFMNEECLTSHAKFLGSPMVGSKIIPVPMDRRNKTWVARKDHEKLRIICVGRIVPFKAYNFSLPPILSEIRIENFAISCDIYGHGTHERDLLESIREASTTVHVSFRGTLPFENFDEIVSKYDLFIGMGTAAVQAAQLGIPTILTIDNDADHCYGYISEVPFGNVGEVSDRISKVKIRDAILRHIAKSENELRQVSEQCSRAANAYNSENYVESALYGSNFNRTTHGMFSRIYASMYRVIGERNTFTKAVATLLKLRVWRNPQ